MTTPSASSPSTPNPQTTKRLLHELQSFSTAANSPSSPSSSSTTPRVLASLTPVSDDSLLSWRAVLLGPTSTPYAEGRWLLSIAIPPTYPIQPPVIRFETKICHPNVNFKTGEICLDLLKDQWTPAYTIEKTLEAIWSLLQEGGGEVDSPLNVDLAALLRGGDRVGGDGLVRFYTADLKYEGEGRTGR